MADRRADAVPAFHSALDATASLGLPFYASGEYLPDLPDAAIDTLLDGAIELLGHTHPLRQVVIFGIGQGVTAVPDEAPPSPTATPPTSSIPSSAGAIQTTPSR